MISKSVQEITCILRRVGDGEQDHGQLLEAVYGELRAMAP